MAAVLRSSCPRARSTSPHKVPGSQGIMSASIEDYPLLELLKSRKFSDFKIRCQIDTFHVHKNILYSASASGYFRVVVDGAFKETLESELSLGENAAALALILVRVYASPAAIPSDALLPLVDEIFPGMVDRWISIPTGNSIERPMISLSPAEPGSFDEDTAEVNKLGFRLLISTYKLAHKLMMKEQTGYFLHWLDLALRGLLNNPRYSSASALLLSDVLDSIYSMTDSGDQLRIQTTAICVANQDAPEMKADFICRKVVLQHDRDGWEMGCEVSRRLETKLRHDINLELSETVQWAGQLQY